MLEAVWSAFGIDAPTESEWKQVMAADDGLLSYEATHLLRGATGPVTPPTGDTTSIRTISNRSGTSSPLGPSTY